MRLAFHIQILVLAVLLQKDQQETIYNLPSSNTWPNRETVQYDGDVPQSNRQLGAK